MTYECWTVFVIADSVEGAGKVIREVTRIIEATPQKLTIVDYPKFARMWRCDFELRQPDADAIQACKDRVHRVIRPHWEDLSDSKEPGQSRVRQIYEAIGDSRRDVPAIPEVFSIMVTREAKKVRTGVDEQLHEHKA